MFEKQFTDLVNACAFADAIVETVREPMLVLDANLRVIAASRAFYGRFRVNSEDTEGKLLYELGDGQWDIPRLHALLEKIIPDKGVMDDYEVAHEFPDIGQRTMLLNARQVFYETEKSTHILLGIEDITERRVLEREKDALLQQKDVLLHEMQHRVARGRHPHSHARRAFPTWASPPGSMQGGALALKRLPERRIESISGSQAPFV